jgi:hypothetical protein
MNGGRLYWQTGTTPHVFEMDSSLIVDGAINAGSGIVVTGNASVTGTLTVDSNVSVKDNLYGQYHDGVNATITWTDSSNNYHYLGIVHGVIVTAQ